jgi:putative peptidoglycan lipid II flippase
MRKDAVATRKSEEPAEADAVSRSAFKVMAGGVLGLAAGLASQVVVAAIFGAAADMDAYLTAMVIPAYLAAVLTTGLSFVLIPAFVSEEVKGDAESAWALVGTCFWVTVAALLAAAIAVSLFATNLITVTAPGFRQEKAELAANMLSVMAFTVPFAGLGSLASGIQNARNKFFWPSAAQGAGSLGNVAVLVILYPHIGAMALAWGNLVAAALAGLVPTVPVLRHGWKRKLCLTDPRILRLGVLITPFMVLGLVTRSTGILERYFASSLPDGNVSYLGYAGKISSIIVVVLAGSIASAIFPTMARQFANRGRRGLAEQTEYGLRLTFATALPSLAVLGALALPLVESLFERGAFSHATAVSVSSIVLIVLLGDVLFRMIGNIIGRTLYVIDDTVTYPLISASAIAFYIPLAMTLTNLWGYIGLALALPIQAAVANALGVFVVSRKVKFRADRLRRYVSLYLIASLFAASSAWWLAWMLASVQPMLQLFAGSIVGGSVYLLMLQRIDPVILHSILEMLGLEKIMRRLKRARSSGPINEEREAI